MTELSAYYVDKQKGVKNPINTSGKKETDVEEIITNKIVNGQASYGCCGVKRTREEKKR